MQGVRARYDAELPPFISIVWHPSSSHIGHGIKLRGHFLGSVTELGGSPKGGLPKGGFGSCPPVPEFPQKVFPCSATLAAESYDSSYSWAPKPGTRVQMSANVGLQNSAKNVQKGTKERKRALPCKNCKQPGLKQPSLGTPNFYITALLFPLENSAEDSLASTFGQGHGS